jgi:hypothetical protein
MAGLSGDVREMAEQIGDRAASPALHADVGVVDGLVGGARGLELAQPLERQAQAVPEIERDGIVLPELLAARGIEAAQGTRDAFRDRARLL